MLLKKNSVSPSFPSKLIGNPVNKDPSVKLKKKKLSKKEIINEIITEKIMYCFVAGFIRVVCYA